MIIDMHVHTSISSPCSMIDIKELIPWARKAGLDGLCVTDHEESLGAQLAYEMGLKEGFPIFRGIEVYTDAGDVLLFGVHDDSRRWHWRTPIAEVVELVREAGGIIIPAHPCRGSDDMHSLYGNELAELLLDSSVAVETYNGGSSPENNQLAERLRERYGLFGIGGSDAHFQMQIGRCFTVFDKIFKGEDELIGELKAGSYYASRPSSIELG